MLRLMSTYALVRLPSTLCNDASWSRQPTFSWSMLLSVATIERSMRRSSASASPGVPPPAGPAAAAAARPAKGEGGETGEEGSPPVGCK